MRSPNHFLSALDQNDFDALAPFMHEVMLRRDDIINGPQQAIRDVYLPIDCILSVITVMQDGAQVESRTIGREGGHGLLHTLGAAYSHEKMIVQIGGSAIRIGLTDMRRLALERPGLVRVIARHAQAAHAQLAQTVACNGLHPAHARLARWLLETRERMGADILPLTQEHLSIMLGVQRTTVNPIAQHLQDLGLIHYRRGMITILDPERLQHQSCECFEAVQRTFHATTGDLAGKYSEAD